MLAACEAIPIDTSGKLILKAAQKALSLEVLAHRAWNRGFNFNILPTDLCRATVPRPPLATTHVMGCQVAIAATATHLHPLTPTSTHFCAGIANMWWQRRIKLFVKCRNVGRHTVTHRAYESPVIGVGSESDSKIRTRTGSGRDSTPSALSAPSAAHCQPVSRRCDSSCCK